MKPKVKIKIDDREPTRMIELCKEAGMEVVRTRLKEGDYICDDVCIERKQIDDFCNSIMNGRFKRQVDKMKKKFKYNYILVSGVISKRNSMQFHEHSILGKIASLMVREKMNIVTVETDEQLAYLMERIFTKHMEVKHENETDK